MKIPLTLFSLFLAGKFQFTLIKRREKQLPSKQLSRKALWVERSLDLKWSEFSNQWECIRLCEFIFIRLRRIYYKQKQVDSRNNVYVNIDCQSVWIEPEPEIKERTMEGNTEPTATHRKLTFPWRISVAFYLVNITSNFSWPDRNHIHR